MTQLSVDLQEANDMAFLFSGFDAKAIGARIKALRIQNHMTVSQVCDAMMLISEQSVYKWQRGDSIPTPENLYALSILFHTSIDYIVKGTEEREEGESPLLPVFG